MEFYLPNSYITFSNSINFAGVTVTGSSDNTTNVGTGFANQYLDFQLPSPMPYKVTFEVGKLTPLMVPSVASTVAERRRL